MTSPSVNPSDEIKVKNGKRVYIALAVALITAATPGVYSALEAAKATLKQRQEVVVRDRQEGDLQKHIKALQVEVEALRKSAVTYRDLVELVLKLKATRQPRRVRHPQPAVSAREDELARKLAALRKRAEVGAQAVKQAAAVKRATPRLKPAKHTRQQVLKANKF